jgi:HAD superfamily hydrolase (TIGR01509 family)
MVLNEHGLLAQLSALVTADDVSKGKPHPETFLRAAELMGVAPQHCVVFEDTDMGRKAAVDGGMACFMVDNTRLIY